MNREMYSNTLAAIALRGQPRRAERREDQVRQAEARRRLEEYREQQMLRVNISDVFTDDQS